MKAAEATDSLRASKTPGKFADNLACNARELYLDSLDVLSDKDVKRRGESISCAAASTKLQLKSHAAESKKKGEGGAATWGVSTHADSDARRDQVLKNLLQTGGIKSKSSSSVANVAASMDQRRRRFCSCSCELGQLSTREPPLKNSSCNCNMENCAWNPSHPCTEEGLSAPSFKAPRPWRSSSDQFNSNAALHRALAAMKKVSGEPDAVKKTLPKSRGALDRSSVNFTVPACEIETAGRSITSSDARTLSMRERGRWGNSKMQQQLCGSSAAAHLSCAAVGSGQNVKPSVSSDHLHPHQSLQHLQCLHCGSFSTTPVLSVSKGARSNSFGRRVRDYSWQQEMQQEQKRPEQLTKEAVGSRPLSQSERVGSLNSNVDHQCEYMRRPDEFPECELGGAGLKMQHPGARGTMSWQERYMLLCQAIAAGAFVDAPPDDHSGIMLPSRGYSWAVCECTACKMGGEAGSFRRMAPANFCSTSSGERMMELEAFSGPIGYVSESKGTELGSIMEKRTSRRGTSRWWGRLPRFGKASKSNNNSQQSSAQKASVWGAGAGQNTDQCSVCRQRVWVTGEEEVGARLCPECLGRTGGDGSQSGPIPTTTATRGPTPPRAARSRPFQPPPFSSFAAHHHQSLPRRWRLIKLCRYLVGFPLQR